MKTSTQIMLRKIAATIVVSNLAISAILCAPSQQPATGTASSSASSSQISPNNGAQLSAASKTNSTPKLSSAIAPTGAGQLSSAASVANGSPSFVNIRSASSGAPNNNVQDEMDTFDGKNPFSDDSLWQIPVHLVRDQQNSDTGNDNMAKSASEMSNNSDEDSDADEPSFPVPASLPQSSSSSPTIISASTDLKTAAGYHYPTHGHHHGYAPSGHHDAGHHGAGHYGGGDHYGKYFQ